MSNNVVVNDLGRGALVVTGSGATATVSGTQVYGATTMTGTGVTVSGTTTLSARPGLDTSHPYDAATTTPTTPTVPTVPTVPTTPPEAGHTLNGGSRNDSLNGGSGADTINGAGGNDTLRGNDGADLIQGGKGNDVLVGGAGNDWLSGDGGSDTISGGAGSDIFHTWRGAGADRVLDFNYAEGDRVQLDPGAWHNAYQSGADMIIDLGGGSAMTLAGVSQASLGSDWLFTA
jgi:Ca2+-binding RTX toxin-like protein